MSICDSIAYHHNEWLRWADRLQKSDSKEYSKKCHERMDSHFADCARYRSILVKRSMLEDGYKQNSDGYYEKNDD